MSARCNGKRDAFCMSLYVAGEVGSGNRKDVEGGLKEGEEQMAGEIERIIDEKL